MADPSITQQVNYGLKSIEITLSATATMADIIYQALKMFDDDKAVRSMNHLIKNNNTEYITCDVDELETLKKRLELKGVGINKATGERQEGVLGVITKDDQNNRRGMIIFNKKYRELALDTVRSFYAERNGGVVDFNTLSSYSNGMMREIGGLTKEELLLYDKQCVEYKVPYYVSGPNYDLYTITFGDRDQEEMERIKVDAATAMTGQSAPIYKKQLQFENDNLITMRQAVFTGELNDKKIEKGTVIVDRSGKTITFDDKFVTCSDIFGQQEYKRKNGNFKYMTSDFVCSMDKPVILTPKEYQEYMLETNKSDYLIKKLRHQGCPELTKEDVKLLATEMRQRDILEKKLMKDFPRDMVDRPVSYNMEKQTFLFTEEEQKNFEKEFEKAKDIPPDKDYYEEFADKCENMETIVCDRDVESVETEEYVIDGRVPTNLDIRQEEILNELADKVPEADIPDLED